MSKTDAPAPDRRDRAALLIAAALALVAAVIVWNTARMGGAAAYSRVGPTAFPYAIAAALFILAACTAVSAWRGQFPAREPEAVAPVIWIIAGLAAQMLLLKVAGFSIATGMLFALTAKAFGRGRFWLKIPIGIALSFAVWAVFAKGLALTLPAGPLERLF